MTDAHVPVLLDEVIASLSPGNGEVFVDGTFGAGGYARGILDKADTTVIGIDRDMTALEMAKPWVGSYADRLRLIHGNFSDASDHLKNLGFEQVDGIVLDLGVSSMQLDQAERGFSFRFDGPLDMRMDRSGRETAADIVNTADEKDLADIIYQYGEEKASRKIAGAIVRRRAEKSFETTSDLANLVRGIVRKSPGDCIDPATRTFQALRLKVNDELGEVERLLESTLSILKENGRLVVVTFHSLEDRIVKNFFNAQAKPGAAPSRYLPSLGNTAKPSFSLLTRKPVLAGDDEVARNPRARSAKLRAGIRLAA